MKKKSKTTKNSCDVLGLNNLNSILDSIPYGIDIVDDNLNILWMNKKLLSIFGKNSLGKKCYKMYKQDRKQCEKCPLKKKIQVGESKILVVPNILGNKTFEITHTGILWGGKKVVLEVFRDITERDKISSSLKESEEKYRNVSENASDGIVIIQDQLIKYGNPALSKIYGDSLDNLLNHNFLEYISPEEKDRVNSYYKRRFSGEKVPSKSETILLGKNGEKIYVELNANIISYHGEPADLVIIRDITQRKEIEKRLKESAERFHTLFESANDAIWLLDGNKFVDCNKNAIKLFGCSNKKEIINHTPLDFSPTKQPDGQYSKDKALKYISLALKGNPQRIYWKHTTSNRGLIDVEISLNRVLLNGKNYLQAIGRDITSRILIEEQLKKEKQNVDNLVKERTDELSRQKNFLDLILKNIPDMVFVKDAKTLNFNLINDAGEDLLGRSRKKLIGKSDYDFFPKEQADFFIKKDREVLEKRKLIDIPEEPIQTARGKRFLHTKKIPIYDSLGNPEYLLGISDDITEQKQAEEAKSQFFSNISHELRTPITPIKSQLQRLLDKELNREEQKEAFEMMMRNTMRLDRLIQDILEMTRIRSGRFSIVRKKQNFNETIEHALSDLYSQIKNKKVRIIFSPKQLPSIYFDRDRLLEVLINLIDNSIKYGNKLVKIETKIIASNLIVSVEDNGKGISEHDLKKIFLPFYRSNNSIVKKIEGTGLGLAISKEIIESHGGKLWVKSKLGKGSTFFFSIPVEGQ